jgi:hypothetical protein
MQAKYETLDEYLDALDAIKEQVADRTRGMTAKQAKATSSAPHGDCKKRLERRCTLSTPAFTGS